MPSKSSFPSMEATPTVSPPLPRRESLNFEEAVGTIHKIFTHTPPSEPLLPKVKAFAKKNLPTVPEELAVEICYRIAAMPLPKDEDFSLPPLQLEETVPLSTPIQLSEVISEVKAYLRSYVVVPPTVLTILAYFAAATWLSPKLSVSPYLFVTSGTPGAGKTTVALAVMHLCYRACMASSASSSAAISRLCCGRPCTILIDEIDSAPMTFMQELTALLNSGSSGGGDVKRLVVDKDSKGRMRVASLQTYGPKILVGLHGPSGFRTLQPATVSRCILVTVAGTGSKRPYPLPTYAQDKEAASLRRKLATVSELYANTFLDSLPELHELDQMPSRTREKYLALVVLASLVDSECSSEDTTTILNFIRASQVPEADVGRYVLAACANVLMTTVAPALRALRSEHLPSHIQGLNLIKHNDQSPVVVTLEHEPVLISGTHLGKEKVSKLRILRSGKKFYVRAIELLAMLLLDTASPLHTVYAGRPMPLPDFARHLKAYGCTLERISSHRGLFCVKDLSVIMLKHLDSFDPSDL